MGKRGSQNHKKSAKASRDRALNAFDTAVYDDYYVKGLRHQQDIDLEHISDERIREMMSGQVNSEDDEEIDSDEAMGSASDISLGEPDSDNEGEWGESLDEAELLPLSEVWDLNQSDDDEENDNPDTSDNKSPHKEGKKKHSTEDRSRAPPDESEEEEDHSSNEMSDDSSGEADSEEESEEEISDGEDSGSDANSDALLDDESDLSESDDDDDEEEEDNEAIRQAIKKIGSNNGAGAFNSKLAHADEENPFALPQSTSENTLTLQDLVPGTGKSKAIAVPAPQRIQERADRGAAYELAKEEVNKWSDVVSANRRAEHLQFPINPPPEFQPASPMTPAAPKERNALENSVAKILNDSQLADEQTVSTFEELAPSKLSFEELRERRNQLRYMRDLMLREEQRNRRINKIKSKKYRKIHKKERERLAELERDDDEEDHESIEKAERQRALERATLRHKNNSKWAQQILAHGLTRDSQTRADVEEMLRQSDALRQKIRGQEEQEEYDDDNYTLDAEEQKLNEDSNENDAPRSKGVLGMKFMQDADKREREANKRLFNDDYDSDEENSNLGRKSYNPAGQQLKRDIQAMEEAEEYDERRSRPHKNARKPGYTERVERGDEVIELVPQDSREQSSSSHKNKNYASSSNDSVVPSSSSSSSSHQPAQSVNENPWLKATSDTSGPKTVKLAPASRNTKDTVSANGKPSKNANIVLENTFGDSLIREKDFTLQQQALVRQAFAGDDVVAEFEAEKKADIDEAGDQEIDETLPGWGSWSNEKPRVRKIRKVIGVNEKQRKDYKKQDVIINEKINKKAAKYNASAVPFPFENRQQYERSLRMPIGQEWVSKDTFQRQTKPRVLVKRGSVIDPIKKPHSN